MKVGTLLSRKFLFYLGSHLFIAFNIDTLKAFTDHLDKDMDEAYDTSYSHGVIVGIGMKGDKSVIYKAGKSESDNRKFLELSKTWFEEEMTSSNNSQVYDNISQPLQWEVGEMTKAYSFREKNTSNAHCALYWMQKKYHPNLCIHGVTKTDTVFLIDGVLLKQKYKQMAFPSNVDSMPLFHLQEWKKSYSQSQLLPFHSGSVINSTSTRNGVLGWILTQEGAIPL